MEPDFEIAANAQTLLNGIYYYYYYYFHTRPEFIEILLNVNNFTFATNYTRLIYVLIFFHVGLDYFMVR